MTSPARRADGRPIHFTAVLEVVGRTTLMRLPPEASTQLPSRGQVAVRAAVGGHEFGTVVEPDGRSGHWIRLEDTVARAAGVATGDTVEVTVEVAEDWPEPEVPPDLSAALDAAPAQIQRIWEDITPMARWEWVRWLGATKSDETRRRRVEVSIDKMDHGKRRPCCFDLSSCTDPDVSRGGKLS